MRENIVAVKFEKSSDTTWTLSCWKKKGPTNIDPDNFNIKGYNIDTMYIDGAKSNLKNLSDDMWHHIVVMYEIKSFEEMTPQDTFDALKKDYSNDWIKLTI